MRRVKVFNWVKPEGEKHHVKTEMGIAKFHQFGVNYEEFESGPGNFSTAIVEWDDGTIENVYVEMIQFVED